MRTMSWVGAVALSLTFGVAASGFGGGKEDPGWGRVTQTHVAHEGLSYALANSTVSSAATSRLNANNDLVDFGAHVVADLGYGYQVQAYLNFEPVGAAPRLGDISADVLVSYGGSPMGMLGIQNPTPTDDTTTPGFGPNVLDRQSYRAVTTADAHATIDAWCESRFGSGLELYDTDAEVLSTGWDWVVQVRYTFKHPDGSDPPPGSRAVVANVRVNSQLLYAYVESYWAE